MDTAPDRSVRGRLILVTGGARSGKSTYAERLAARLAEPCGGRVTYIATSQAHDEEMARQSLNKVNALAFADRRVGELSGGEAQRILLARALCQSTPILLLDEPTAHLDLQYQVSLLELIRELAHTENLAVLIALHDLNLAARYADRVALLVGGHLTSIGAPRQVLTAEAISHAYCLPVHVVEHPFMDSPLVLPQ